MLDQLRRSREDLAQPAQAVAAQRELLSKMEDTDWEVTFATRDLAQIFLRAEQWQDAYVTITSLDERLSAFDDWKPYGLGRMVVESALDISLGLPTDHPQKAAALAWATKWLRDGCSFSPLLVEKGIAAAQALEDTETERFFAGLG